MRELRMISETFGTLRFTTEKENGRPAPYVFANLYGTGKPETNVFTTQGVRQDGATFFEAYMGPRTMQFACYVYGAGFREMYAGLAKLNAVISNMNKQIRIEYENDFAAWYIYGSVQSRAEYQPRLSAGYNMQFTPVELDIFCPDPFWRLIGEQSDTEVGFAGGEFEFPFEIVSPGVEFATSGYFGWAENIGDAPAPLEIWINGPASSPRLTNQTTGVSVAFDVSLAPYEYLYLNTAKGETRVEIGNLATGQTRSAWNTFVTGQDISITSFMLQPGMNDLLYSNASELISQTKVRLAWQSRLSGV